MNYPVYVINFTKNSINYKFLNTNQNTNIYINPSVCPCQSLYFDDKLSLNNSDRFIEMEKTKINISYNPKSSDDVLSNAKHFIENEMYYKNKYNNQKQETLYVPNFAIVSESTTMYTIVSKNNSKKNAIIVFIFSKNTSNLNFGGKTSKKTLKNHKIKQHKKQRGGIWNFFKFPGSTTNSTNNTKVYSVYYIIRQSIKEKPECMCEGKLNNLIYANLKITEQMADAILNKLKKNTEYNYIAPSYAIIDRWNGIYQLVNPNPNSRTNSNAFVFQYIINSNKYSLMQTDITFKNQVSKKIIQEINEFINNKNPIPSTDLFGNTIELVNMNKYDDTNNAINAADDVLSSYNANNDYNNDYKTKSYSQPSSSQQKNSWWSSLWKPKPQQVNNPEDIRYGGIRKKTRKPKLKTQYKFHQKTYKKM